MKYQSEFFEATASGVALENGGIGQEIKVRNDASKKVVSGQVLEAGIVRVQ
jgi:flagella basal body P-ring formation protein FlgA